MFLHRNTVDFLGELGKLGILRKFASLRKGKSAPSVTKKAIKVTDERTAGGRRELKGCLVRGR